MITLTNNNQTLRVSTNSSSNIDVCVFYEDRSNQDVKLGDEQTHITEATTKTILTFPSTNKQRQVKYISINNTSVFSNTIIVKKT